MLNEIELLHIKQKALQELIKESFSAVEQKAMKTELKIVNRTIELIEKNFAKELN